MQRKYPFTEQIFIDCLLPAVFHALFQVLGDRAVNKIKFLP